MIKPAPICQIAFTVLDVKRQRRWYQDLFDLVPAGQTNLFFGPLTTRVQGIPQVAERCFWLVDSEDFFQLEMFQFWHPRSKAEDPTRRVCDLGYTIIGLHVADFDALSAQLAQQGITPCGAAVGPRGNRRLCLRDPEGVFLEVLEADPLADKSLPKSRPSVPTTIRSITLSVPDLEQARRTFQELFLLPEAVGITLHEPEHEALWGLEGARRKSLVLDAGRILLELVEYIEPLGKPRPSGYRICDQGLMNIALGARHRFHFDALFERAVTGGCTPNGKPLEVGVMKVMYVNDPQNTSIELLYVEPWAYRLLGFTPALQFMNAQIRIKADVQQVWNYLSDHDTFHTWLPFRACLVPPGSAGTPGPGTVRRLTGFGLNLKEEIKNWQPPEWYSYVLRSGAPLRDYYGHVRLQAFENTTQVTWSIRFKPALPGTGTVTRLFLQWIFDKALQTLKQNIEADLN